MKPIKFKEATKNLVKPSSMTDEECSGLWVHCDGRECTSCWKMSFNDRLRAMLFGRIWLSVLSGNTQPPVCVSCAKTVFVKQKVPHGSD